MCKMQKGKNIWEKKKPERTVLVQWQRNTCRYDKYLSAEQNKKRTKI